MSASQDLGANPGAWDTADMKSALPAASEGGQGDTSTTVGEKKKVEGWVDAKPYEYDTYTRDSTANDWDGNAKVYEWDGEEGDVGPKVPELETELFGAVETRVSHGIDFSK